jgi:hypothetical protein
LFCFQTPKSDSDDSFDLDAHIDQRVEEEFESDANDANDLSCLEIPCVTPGETF